MKKKEKEDYGVKKTKRNNGNTQKEGGGQCSK